MQLGQPRRESSTGPRVRRPGCGAPRAMLRPPRGWRRRVLDDARDLVVAARANRPRQGFVGDIADERVLEGGLALALEAATASGSACHVQRARLRRFRRRLRRGARPRCAPRSLTNDRSGLEQPRCSSSRASDVGQHRVDAVGKHALLGAVLLAQPVDHLLGERRSASGLVGDLLGEFLVDGCFASQGTDQRARPRDPGDRGDRRRVPAPATQAGRRSSSSSQARQTIRIGPWLRRRGARPGPTSPRRPSGCPRSRSQRTAARQRLQNGADSGEDAVAGQLRVGVLVGSASARLQQAADQRRHPQDTGSSSPPSPSSIMADEGAPAPPQARRLRDPEAGARMPHLHLSRKTAVWAVNVIVGGGALAWGGRVA